MSQKPLKIWYGLLLAMILAMITVGGITRLTRSGLSITEWKPVTGILPPLSEQAWIEEFAKYRQTPEYKKLNLHFELHDYKQIYFWEFVHRALGRLLFFTAFLGGLILWHFKQVRIQRVLLISALIAAQGLVGWIMVKSGLVDAPHVSPYKLATHFFAAIILLLVTYKYMSQMRENNSQAFDRIPILSFGGLLLVQMFFGCLTAGWKAGYSMNDFPFMAGRFFPGWRADLNPAWINIFDNPMLVQFTHRWLGVSLFFFGLWVSLKLWKSLRRDSVIFLSLLTLQVLLGIFTLMFWVPISLGVLHQLMAALLLLQVFRIAFCRQAL